MRWAAACEAVIGMHAFKLSGPLLAIVGVFLCALGSCDRPNYIGLGHGYFWYTTQGPFDHANRAHLVYKSEKGYELVASGVSPIESIIVRDESLIVFRAVQDENRERGLYAYKPGRGIKRAMASNAFDAFKVERTPDGIHVIGFQEGKERSLTWQEIEARFSDTNGRP